MLKVVSPFFKLTHCLKCTNHLNGSTNSNALQETQVKVENTCSRPMKIETRKSSRGLCSLKCNSHLILSHLFCRQSSLTPPLTNRMTRKINLSMTLTQREKEMLDEASFRRGNNAKQRSVDCQKYRGRLRDAVKGR